MFRSDRLILGLSLRAHMGGRWVLSWPVVGLAAPLVLVGGMNNMTDVTTTGEVGPWILVSLIGAVVALGLFLLGCFTFMPHRVQNPVPMWRVIVLGALIGASRSVVTMWVSDSWGLVDVTAYYAVIRMVTGALLGGTLLPLTVVLVSIVATYVTQRRELELELRDLEVERMRQSGRSEALREALLLQVTSELTEAAGTVDANEARQMSRRLWESVPAPVAPAVSWREVLRVAITHNPYPIALTTVLWVISAFGSSVLAIGFIRGFVLTTLTSTSIVVSFAAARRLTVMYPRAAVLILVGVIFVLTLWSGLVAPLLVGVSAEEWTAATVIATVIWIPVLVITAGMVVSAVRSGDQVVNRLRDVIEDQQVAMAAEVAETSRIQQELATVLHGSVQSRLLAAAAVIRQPGIADETMNDPGSALQGALALMSQSSTRGRDFAEEVVDIVRSWAPLMAIDVPDVEFGLSLETQLAALRVIEEGLSNAYRHGGATEVRVKVDPHDSTVSIRIEDNGSGISAKRSPGLGSAVLDSVAPGAWSLTDRECGGAALHVLLRERVG